MATKKSAATKTANSTVVRIKATDSAATTPKPAAPAKIAKPAPTHNRLATPLIALSKAIGGYFKGSWQELRQVRWPDRKATWGLTGAVLAFTAFFIILILLLDALFKYVFQLILG